MIGFTLRATERAVFGEITGVDRKGNPTGAVEHIRYTIEPGSETFLEWVDDGGTQKLSAIGPTTPAGSPAKAKITADVDLDEGEEKDVEEFIEVEIVAGDAVVLSIGAPTIEEQP